MGGREEARQGRPRALIRLNRKRLIVTAVVLLVLGGCGKLCANMARDQRFNAAGWQARHNILAIQLAIERFSCDSRGEYPTDINEVRRRGYLDAFPQNPYSGLLRDIPGLEQRRPMQALKPGEYCPGDFVYLPIADARNSTREVVSYTLVVCGYYEGRCVSGQAPVSPSTSGVYTADEAEEITRVYYRPDMWK